MKGPRRRRGASQANIWLKVLLAQGIADAKALRHVLEKERTRRPAWLVCNKFEAIGGNEIREVASNHILP